MNLNAFSHFRACMPAFTKSNSILSLDTAPLLRVMPRGDSITEASHDNTHTHPHFICRYALLELHIDA
jgi:hypothetical protein